MSFDELRANSENQEQTNHTIMEKDLRTGQEPDAEQAAAQILAPADIEMLTTDYPLYSQDKKGGDALVLFRLCIGRASWYVTEGSWQEGDLVMFGLVDLLDVELGYFSLSEMQQININGHTIRKDTTFTPTPLCKLRGERVEEWLQRMKYI